MLPLPQRQTLVSQLSRLLRHEIAEGTWRDWLPNERRLSDALQVSRNTLRRALRQLEREGVIQTRHGAGNRILATPRNGATAAWARDVAILSPEPIERLRPNFTLWIDGLRGQCAARGIRLHLLHSRQCARAKPDQALQRLVLQQPHGCWILILAGRAAQRWFEHHRIPCIVAGTVHRRVDLPSCGQDHRQLARDAAHRMFARGHRQIALLTRRSGLAVDLESEAGFVEAAAEFTEAKVEAQISRHDDTVAGLCQQVRRLVTGPVRTTALLVTNAHYHLTVSGCLHQLGLRVPQDVSLISRTDDPFLNYVVPAPARYAARPREMADGLLSLLEPLLAGESPANRVVHVPPRFIAGESLGPVP